MWQKDPDLKKATADRKHPEATSQNPLKLWASAYPRFYAVGSRIVSEIINASEERIQHDTHAKLQLSVGHLVRDSIAIVLGNRRLSPARIHKSASWYSSTDNHRGLTYRVHIKMAYEGMLRLGYLEETHKGFYGRGAGQDPKKNRLTRFIAADKLLDLFTENERSALPVIVPPPEVKPVRVQVKDADGRKISIPSVRPPKDMLANLQRINRALLRSWYDLNLGDDEIVALQQRLKDHEGEERHVDFSRRTLYRVFNDKKLLTGGRFYGGWWQNVPRDERARIIVNGKPTVEYDYSNMHPVILYSREGLTPPIDSYTAIVDRLGIRDPVEAMLCRSMVKQAFNAMLNTKSPLTQPPRDLNPKPSRFGLRWKDVAHAIREVHSGIAHHFETGIGLQLQRLDSDIAEAVMLHYAEIGVPVLPLHDSFIMHSGYETGLQDVMVEKFEAVVGVAPRVDKKIVVAKKEAAPAINDLPGDEFGDETSLDLDELLASMPGHDKRLDQFYNVRDRRDKKT